MRTLTIDFVNQKKIASVNVDAIESIVLDKTDCYISLYFKSGMNRIDIPHDSLAQAKEQYKALTYFLHGKQKSKKITVWD